MPASFEALRLARRARLRVNKRSGETFLLYPERGLRINAAAAEILVLCDGGHSREEIARILAQRHDREIAGMESDVNGFLDALAERGLLEGAG